MDPVRPRPSLFVWRLAAVLLLAALSAGHAASRIPVTRVPRAEWPGDALAGFVAGGLPEHWAIGANASMKGIIAEVPLVLTATPGNDVWLPLRDDFDLMYIISAEVGTPKRHVRLIVDTGSSDLWLTQASYSADSSLTAFKVPGPTSLLQYGQGRVEGSEVEDRICIGELCIDDQSFVSASEVNGIANMVAFDGLLGLAYPALAAASGATFLQHLSSNGKYDKLAFGLSLQDETNVEGSFLSFGSLDDLLKDAWRIEGADAPGVVLPVFDEAWEAKFWMVRGKATPGSAVFPIQISAALDSGTSLIAVPGHIFWWVLQHILPGELLSTCGPAFGQLICPCIIPMSPLTLSFQGSDKQELRIKLMPADLLQFVGAVPMPDGPHRMCRVAVQPGPPGMNFWILGDVFLRRTYAVHDVQGHRVVLFPRSGDDYSLVVQVSPPGSLAVASAAAATLAAAVAASAVVGALAAERLGCRRRAPLIDVDSYCRL
mmetsp:Transcript_530/g.1067  ORF Transcript_530/g.1067 Transcript_530/m.1067 type:complete len:487 (-) Transcript_530:111-1571(-)